MNTLTLTTDSLRELAIQQLREAEELAAETPLAELEQHGTSGAAHATALLSRVYNEDCDSYSTPDQLAGIDDTVNPMADAWYLASLIALGAIHSLGEKASNELDATTLLAYNRKTLEADQSRKVVRP